MGFLLVAIVSLTATKFAIAGEWDVYYSQFFGEDTVSLHLHGKGHLTVPRIGFDWIIYVIAPSNTVHFKFYRVSSNIKCPNLN